MGLNIVNITVQFLKDNPENKFTAKEIAEWIFKTYPAECKEKQQRSKAKVNPLIKNEDVIQQIAAEVGARKATGLQKKDPKIKTTEGRPRKYYYSNISDFEEVQTAEERFKNPEFSSPKENSLYPKLSEFLWAELGLYSKRIDEKTSSNSRGSRGNIWLHPDVVAMEDLSSEWHKEIKDCVQQYADKKTSLWSFEVKLLINRSNVRDCFFQTVSNSSWANFSYLVAAEIVGSDTLRELRLLASLHGVGFIKLDYQNPPESQILIPARERTEVDWDNINRLAEENKDFMDYIKTIRHFYQTGDIRLNDWDLPEDNN